MNVTDEWAGLCTTFRRKAMKVSQVLTRIALLLNIPRSQMSGRSKSRVVRKYMCVVMFINRRKEEEH